MPNKEIDPELLKEAKKEAVEEATLRINKFIGRMEELIFDEYVSSRDVTNKINSAFVNILGIKPKDRKSLKNNKNIEEY